MLWCAYIKRHDPENEFATEANDVVSNNPHVRDEKEIKSVLKLNIERVHAILGHSNENTTQKTAAALDIQITRGSLKTCEPCTVAKAKQMNVNNENKGTKSD